MRLQTLQKKQLDIFNSTSEYVFVAAGAGSGRTHLAAMLAMKPGNSILACNDITKYRQSGGKAECWVENLHRLGCNYSHTERLFTKPDGGEIKVIFDSELNSVVHADVVVVDDFNNSRKDILGKIKASQYYLMSTPIEDSHHPSYKLAKALIKDNKQYMVVVNGFPFFANNLHSLIDVFGEDVRWYEPELIRTTVHDNLFLLRDCPQYLQMLQVLPRNQREKFLEGKWVFE